ncbi:hypothetical protein BIV60_18145 [Bacillus sp. MUM 116]|uniref:hypothetical protein n=1 Tax=Bacillus sp. MUM 116 TaxID=1678002 RepID=UPI0008F59983|nr:hypothetical protein [Bacillus sp. MUM 116]OIK11500.1 hypothetical protein BIV60_18145 [Bacillus sp. MUM 116]
MKKQVHLFIYVIVFLLIITSPYWLWFIQPAKKLNVLIMDKTVPNPSYREHKGLVWILNNEKYVKNNGKPYSASTDYKGYEPEKGSRYRIIPFPKDLSRYDVFYLTDQYGVYQQDFNRQNQYGEKSEKIYGGLTSHDVNQIEKSLITTKGKTLIAEFNTFASPTSDTARAKISNLLNLDWSGWIGRYFADLNSTEVPQWVKKQYAEKNKKWMFSGQGFVFVNKNNYIVVLDQKELTDNGLLFQVTAEGKSKFKEDLSGKYQYWFDMIQPRNEKEVLATYQLPVTNKAKQKLQGYGIPTHFPAVISHQNVQYTSYYFAGDYADEADVPGIYQTKGFDVWKQHFGTEDSFYWETYVPMLKKILKNGLNHPMKQELVESNVADGMKTNSRTGDSYIQIKRNGKWMNFLIKGVNMGIGKPGHFPGETAITKEEYLRWFKEIGAMNANAIRIYTLHPPAFYEAFYEYNQMAKTPLFLFHGTWVNEENLIRTQDGFAKENMDDAKTEIKNMIDIIHGRAKLAAHPGHASGTYSYDISKYVLGIIVGTEWDPAMVANTNSKHSNLNQFTGKYFKTNGASPFENWLAGLMEYAANYEVDTYHWQHSISFTNWVTTDLLKHPAEPLKNEDMVSVNPNHIKKTEKFHAGLFASYHIYPYYPDFLNYEKKYLNYMDKSGRKNNYAGYLHDLMKAHHMPVLVAEFGVPSSRGLTHKNPYGMNQGFHSEQEQGNIDRHLFQSIVDEGYAGGLVFSWQDEWFKRTWNTMDFDDPDRRPYWDNQQTNEQHFGLLSFEPGNQETAITVDGGQKDWDMAGVQSAYKSNNAKLPVKEVRFTSDSGYLYYILSFNKPVDFNSQNTYLLFDTIDHQGQTKLMLGAKKVNLDYGVDFLMKLAGPEYSKMMVDSYYDTFYYLYANQLKMIKQVPYARQKDNGVFHPIRLALNKGQMIPSTKERIPFQGYETGVLKFGDANPLSKDFNSLTDVSINKNQKVVEGRIPWQLLNIKDPSLKAAMGDIWKNGLTGSVKLKGIRIAIVMKENDRVAQTFPETVNGRLLKGDTILYTWNDWEQPPYYERIKKSYDIMRDTFRSTEIPK